MRRFLVLCFLLWLAGPVASLAATRAFPIGGNNVELTDVTETVEVYFSSLRKDARANRWVFEVRLRNTSVQPLTGPVVAWLERAENTSGLLDFDGRDGEGKPWVNLSANLPSGGLGTGSYSLPRTLTAGASDAVPRLVFRIYAGSGSPVAPPLALMRTLDATGLPLTGVTVTAVGPEGVDATTTDSAAGVATLGRGTGPNTFRFEAPERLPVWRSADLVAGSVRELPSPRLVERSTNLTALTSFGGVVSNASGSIRITVPPGALAGSVNARLTPLTAQTLPALLPVGWSPLQAFWLEWEAAGAGASLHRATTGAKAVEHRRSLAGASVPLPARLELWEKLEAGARAAVVQWNTNQLRWEATGLIDGAGASVVETSLADAGPWAVVIGDPEPAGPPAPVVGAPLAGIPETNLDWLSITAQGRVTPESSPASRVADWVTAEGEIVISNRLGVLPSGTLLRALVNERYRMRDGSIRVTPAYETFISAFQRPGDRLPSTLRSTLPLRPQLLFDGQELQLAELDLEVFPPTEFAGAVVGVGGGAATNGAIRIAAGAGVVLRPQAVRLETLDREPLAGLIPAGTEAVAAFQLTLGELAAGQRLELSVTGLVANISLVLARVLHAGGITGLEPVERLVSEAGGRLASTEPASGLRLPGLSASGQYLLLRVADRPSLVTGIARDALGRLSPRLLVARTPWWSRTDEKGRYRLLSPVGPAEVRLLDLVTGERTSAGVEVPPGSDPVLADLAMVSSGPRVIAVTPADGATNVAPVSAVEVVFSRPLNPATVAGSAVQLLDGTNQPVVAAVTLGLSGDVVSVLPASPLAGGTRHTLKLANTLAGLDGRPLEGPDTFRFTTVPVAGPRPVGAQVTSYEPTNGVARLTGSVGLAEPGSPVVLVNETTGRTTTVLAGVEGAFEGTLAAQVEDVLSVTLVNANGTVNALPISRQVFADGSVALFSQGGTIEVPGEHGPIGFEIEPGSLNGKTRFKFESVPLAQVLTVISNTQPEGGRVLGGVRVSAIQGNPMSAPMDVTFAVNVADMQLPPGVHPTNCAFGLAIARLVDDTPVFELVDRMHFEDGRLVTHSPPFFGLFGPFEDILVLPLLMFTAEVPLLVNGRVYAVDVDPGTGVPLEGATREYLGGAIVSGRGKAPAPGIRGRLRPGTVYSLSAPDGSYTLMVTGDATSASKPVAVSASHPRFPGQRPESVVPDLSSGERFAIGNLLTRRDIIFPKAGGPLDVTPSLTPSHSPAFPAPGEEVTAVFLSLDDSGVPFVSVEVGDVLPVGGRPTSRGDVTLVETGDEPVGATARRVTVTVRSLRPQVVVLRALAADGNGNQRIANYPIVVGGEAPPPADNPPPSDDFDDAGPYVVGMSPPPGSRALAPGLPIVLRFNEPIRREVVESPEAITLNHGSSSVGGLRLQLSEDQTELSVFAPQLQTNTTYTLTVGYAVRDLTGNVLDQRPGETGNQTFVATVATAPTVVAPLDAVIGRGSGSGAVILGSYALIAERRGSDRGRVAVLDLANPSAPRLANEITLPPFPREMTFLPRYAYVYTNGLPGSGGLPEVTLEMFTNPAHPNRVVRTNDLLVVAGGLAGVGQLQWLRVIDVTDPLRPQLIAAAVIGIDGLALPGRLRWSPPTLAYLEISTPADRLSVLNLQSFIIADILATNPAEYRRLPADGDPGEDRNGDGDYVDPGETLPLPARLPVDFGGKEYSLAVPDSDQAIVDFVMQQGGAYLGAILGPGRLLGPDGRPDPEQPVPAAFRTLLDDGITPPRPLASFEFPPGRQPRRVEALFQFPVAGTNGVAVRDLVLVALRGETGAGETNNYVAVLDLTDRLALRQLAEIPLPKDSPEGSIHSLQMREDGLIAVAGDRLTFLLDPLAFGRPVGADGRHPAWVGVIEGVGGTPRRFDTTPEGLHLASDVESRAQLVQTAPALGFAGFTDTVPFDPGTLATRPEAEVEELVAKLQVRSFLRPARLRPGGECSPIVATNLDAGSHHYVVVYAPGGAGPTIELALESLNWAGYPLRKRGFLFPPVHALGAGALETLGQTPGADDAPVRSLRAYRLSSRPASPLFNVYLSRPFLLVAEEVTPTELAELKAQLDREVLWSGYGLRTSLDPSMQTNAVLGAFAGRIDRSERVHQPGVTTLADAFPADLIQSPNPGPVAGEMLLPLALNAVGAHNSELVINATDLVMPGRRMPFEFRRTFRGQSLYDGPFGRGWDFGFNQRIVAFTAGGGGTNACLTLVARPDPEESEVAREGDLLFHTGGGQIVVYRFAGTNAPPEIANDPLVRQFDWLARAARFYLPPDGLFAPMIRFRDGRTVRLEPDGRQYWFNVAGRLERIYDRYEKNFFELVYNARGELVRILDDRRKPIEIGYYRVFSDGEFRAGIDERATRLGDIGRIARLKDYSGRDVLYVYTADGLLERYRGPEIATGPLETFRGRQETIYRYSDSSRPDRTAKAIVGLDGQDVGGAPILSVAAHGAAGRDTVAALNLMGQRLEVLQPHTNTAAGLATATEPVSVTSPDGSMSKLRFDRLGRVTEAVMSGGSGTALTNRQEYFTRGPLRGLVKATVSPLGDRTEFIYDEAHPSLRSRGNLKGIRKIPGPRGGPVLGAQTEYDPLYNLPSGIKTDFNGVETTLVLAADRRSVERISRGGERELFSVNEFGQPESHTALEGTPTRLEYNAEGYLSTRTVGTLQTRYLYAPISGAASDPGLRGLPSQVVDPSGVPTRFVHDELDRLVEEEREGLRVTSAFDAAGNLIRRASQVESNRVAIEEFEYLSHGFLREQRLRDVETDEGTADLVTTYERDAMNRVSRVTFPGGAVHRFIYDELGRLAREEVPDSYTNVAVFDAIGNLTNIVRGTAVEHHVFDGHDRLAATVGANGTRVDYLRDGNGNVRTNRVTDAEGQVLSEVRYEYDALNRLRRKVIRRDEGESAMSIDFDAAGRSTTVTDARGNRLRTFLDPQGRAERIEGPNHQVVFERDPNANVTGRRLLDAGGEFVSGYAFNRRNQLTAATNSLGDVSRYELELDGRQVLDIDREGHASTNVFTLLGEVAAHFQPNGVVERRAFDRSRNIVRFADAATNLTVAVHDAQNRMVTHRLPNGAESVFSGFNAFGQPTRASLPRGVRVESTYDFEGKLTNRVVAGLGPARAESYAYDGLRRLRRVEDPSGTLEVRYDLAGFVRDVTREYRFGAEPVPVAPFSFTVRQQADAAFFRSELEYPVDGLRLTYERDVSGRLTALVPASGEPVIRTNVWIGDTRFASRVMGNGRIRLDLAFDGLPRIVGRRYTRLADGEVLVDVRQAYDRNGAVLARQYVHRGGRTDLFHYDGGYRLLRADLDARPTWSGETPAGGVAGFEPPSGLGGAWQSGFAARVAHYLNTDVLESIETLNPLGLPLAQMATNRAEFNPFLLGMNLDGFERETDAIGNVTRTLLSVRLPGDPRPALVAARLIYNDLGQLVRIERADGVTVHQEYEQNGLRIRRTVTGPADRCVPSDLAFVYDGARLIEERDLAAGAALLRRYYYADDGDELIAGDVRDHAGPAFERVYFLTDNQRSVLAVADATGDVVQRVRYDAWGQPAIDSADPAAPAVSWIRREADGLRVAFSEPVLPAGSAGDGFLTELPSPAGRIRVMTGGTEVAGRWVADEGVAPSGFGSALRFVATAPLAGAGEVRLEAGGLRDEWGIRNEAAVIPVDLSQPAGTSLYTGASPGSTAPVAAARSARGLTILFHGQVWDEDTGLLYCRARYYDPFTASFLQRDPAGFVDSVNPYTAFAHNPVSHRDPTGASVVDDLRQMGETLQEDADKHRETGGPMNLILSMAEEGFAGLLQMPAAVRDSWNVLQSESQGGTLDLLNRMKAAEIVGRAPVAAIGVVASGVGAVQSLKTVSSFLASRARGMAFTLTRKMRLALGRGTAIDHLMHQGLTRWEAEGFVNALAVIRDKYKSDNVEASVRSFGDKADLRRQAREMGIAVKPEWVKNKTSKEHGIVHVGLKQADGTMIHRDFVGDLDFYQLKVNGRRIEEHEFQRIKHIFNREMSKAYRRQGYRGDPGASVLHGAHLNLPEIYGRRVEHLGAELGKKQPYARKAGGEAVFEVLPNRRDFHYDMDLMNAIKGPGPEAFAVRIDGLGRVNAYQPDVGLLRRDLDAVARQFRWSTGIELGEYGWYRDFDLPAPPSTAQ